MCFRCRFEMCMEKKLKKQKKKYKCVKGKLVFLHIQTIGNSFFVSIQKSINLNIIILLVIPNVSFLPYSNTITTNIHYRTLLNAVESLN